MAKRILILFVLVCALISPHDLSSCGPFLPETVFTSKLEPLDEPRYFRGRLDILQPRYRRIYLMAAYRYLAGIGLDMADQQALLSKPAQPDFWGDRGSAAIEEWLHARVQLGAPPIDQIDRFKVVPDNVYILNCGDDAFRNAAATMIERSRSGVSHQDLRLWVAAQDQVFANCSSPAPAIPAPLPVNALHSLQADRAYQIAAAEFYAGQFDAASADFLRIAADPSSPWHGAGPYLAARALIRKATLGDAGTAPSAQEQLRKVIADPDAAVWHESARGLARFLRNRTEPAAAIREAARVVESQRSGVAGAMNDYRLMLDRYGNRGEDVPRDDDITDWIVTMQNGTADHALAKWRTTRSTPWLAAALTYAAEPDPELMAAAAGIADSSPAFTSVQFHCLRLMPSDQARPRLEAMLRRKMPASARNLFLAARMRVSRGWDELLRYAPRTAAGAFVVGEGERPSTAKVLYFDDDAARILDRQAPIETLRLAARNSSLPPNLQLQSARAVWMRSILLDDTTTASGIAAALGSLAPDLQPYLDGYLSAKDENARRFAAAWLMLNIPGMRPSIDAGAGRLTPMSKIDTFRDNWWCPPGVGPSSEPPPSREEPPLNAPLALLYQGSSAGAAFLSSAQRAQVLREREGLGQAPAASTFMARYAIEWADAHPDDPRIPESLRLVVRAGHYACGGDSQTDALMERAFKLLHKRYPDTEASRRTPYWYRVNSR